MLDFEKLISARPRTSVVPTVALSIVVLLATWMGLMNGGYFASGWMPVAFVLAALLIAASLVGSLWGAYSRWTVAAVVLFAAYAAWTCASVLWSANRADAWLGTGQTMLYLLAFGVAVSFFSGGASRRWVLAGSVLGPAAVAALTLTRLAAEADTIFENNRLVGTVGYYNGEAAFLLLPFWVAVYLAGSRSVNPVLRGLTLAGATLCVEVAALTQSRGALVAAAVSLPVFFLFSGQRLRGLIALLPVALALLASFTDLNDVYLTFLNGGDPVAVLERAVPTVWFTAAVAGVYGAVWGIVDGQWRPYAGLTRAAGVVALVIVVAVVVAGSLSLRERVGDPVAWAGQKWEAFKTDDTAGQEQSRYLSASGSGRIVLWQVAWRDFVGQPLLGIGTYNYEATYYRLRERPVGYVRQAHSLPLEVLSERGVVGGSLFFGFLGTCLAAGLWYRFRGLDTESKALVGALLASVTYWLVHSSAEWFWQLPAVTLPAIVYLAALVVVRRRRRGAEDARPRALLPRLAATASAVSVVAAFVPLYVADRYLVRSYTSDNPWVALQAVEQAQRFNPLDPQPYQREADLAIQMGNWPRAEEAYGEAIRLNPEHYAPYTLLARFFEGRGNTENSLRLYRKALSFNPLEKELRESIDRLDTQSEGGEATR